MRQDQKYIEREHMSEINENLAEKEEKNTGKIIGGAVGFLIGGTIGYILLGAGAVLSAAVVCGLDGAAMGAVFDWGFVA